MTIGAVDDLVAAIAVDIGHGQLVIALAADTPWFFSDESLSNTQRLLSFAPRRS